MAKEERKKTYDNLKNTLDELEGRIRRANSSLIGRNFAKKKTKENIGDDQDLKYDKNRETISTETTNLCMGQPRITSYITSQPKPANFHPFISNPYDSKKFNSYYIS